MYSEKGSVVLLGDFNARVGTSVEIDDVVGMLIHVMIVVILS